MGWTSVADPNPDPYLDPYYRYVFLILPDPHPDPLVRETDPALDPEPSTIEQK